MRIRKRKVPLPLSSLSPVPIWSDPNLSQPTMVQLKLDQNPHPNLSLIADAASYFDPQPSDQPSQSIGGGSTDLVDLTGAFEAVKALMEEEDGRRGEVVESKSNDSRKGDVGAEIEATVLKQPSSSHQAGGRWFEGEKAFPLKKRRGSVERRSSDEMVMEKDKKMKTKVNKKCEQQNGAEQEEIKETKEDVIPASTNSAKKRARGGALMEGSRCSRVNGRGWRCCQQTLVGYSLCEHHLGKGRLRSMNNVRSRPKANNSTTRAALKKANSQPLSSLGNYSSSLEDREPKPKAPDHTVDGGNEGEDHEKKPLVIMKKKKMKLGTVKARSLSSLLGLANEAISMAENEN